MSASRLPAAVSRGLFVTGTEAGCGKTTVAAGILNRLGGRGMRVAGMKPVASGCASTPDGLRNTGALILQDESFPRPVYDDVNPYAFAPAVAPRAAAREAGVAIELEAIRTAFERLAREADIVVVEGPAGWAEPLGPELTSADLARALGLPVLLVVALRPGCLELAPLAARAVKQDGCKLAGWVANAVDPDPERPGVQLQALRRRLAPSACLGVVDHHRPATPGAVTRHLRPDRLLAAAGYPAPGSQSRISPSRG